MEKDTESREVFYVVFSTFALVRNCDETISKWRYVSFVHWLALLIAAVSDLLIPGSLESTAPKSATF